MTHEELLAKIKDFEADNELDASVSMYALRAVVELHKPIAGGKEYPKGLSVSDDCAMCDMNYPCQTIQAIEKELK